MPEFTQGHSQHWTQYFAAQGHSARPLAAGVEGAVYDLGDGRIAKVWRRRGVAELEGMQRLYADVMDARLPFGTPEILAVEYVNGTPVTYERKLPGQPLQDQLAVEAYAVAPAAARCVIDVLQALAAVPASTAMRQLAVLDEGQPLWAGAQTFRAALMNLLRRRVARFGAVLRRRLPDFDLCCAGLADRLETLPACPDTVIHGDLVPGNILVDAQARPLAILDFGFLTTAGDPRLDAAIAASVMNMYGSHAPAITAALTAQVAAELSYPVEVLLTYQAVYAVATANAFTADGSDGHFAWCISQLRRPDIAAALGL